MFIALDVSLDLIRALRPVMPVIELHDRDLADQLRRAASSITLNLGEGRYYAIAHGSAGEVRAALATAQAWGWIGDEPALFALLDRVLALLWRLTH